MPYESKAQQRKFHADPRLRKYAAEYDAATNFKNLPERKKRKKRSTRYDDAIRGVARARRSGR